ncbi:cytochrome c oxidase assembly protein subunit 11 [Breoghania corrubedonensis]|uniref:Cytochrome c oxidase assembly protein CtaG n=1 Tax=Breoghania corrubedonensis TaxID=665038 RepID=A0A2T5VES7_9HYPH|nr:cytochrome c oxidase assembly protein [Breoghania corrubedonensis]PTW62262.1 cytochrome c oxidase assembly protein subunit 11 [Breoghania corrubedonensis]
MPGRKTEAGSGRSERQDVRAGAPERPNNGAGRGFARRNRTLALACVAFVGCMVGAAYAAVPLYQIFCAVTGYGGTTQRAQAAPVQPIDRHIKVRFDGNVGTALPWSFKPVKRQVELRLGEVATELYHVVNLGNGATAGTATFNVTPFEAGAYFNKLDCFCFTEQDLAGGEARDMPVVFFVDPAMDEDPNLAHIDTITLSYTFFPAKTPERPVATVAQPSNSGEL